MAQAALKQNDYEDNGLSPLTLEGQLRAAQQAARQAQEKAKAQKSKMAQLLSRGGRADNYGAGSMPQGNQATSHSGTSILPIGIGELASSSLKDDEARGEDDENSGFESYQAADMETGEESGQGDAVQLAYLKAEEQKRRALIESQTEEGSDGSDGADEAADNPAGKAFGLMKWWLENKKVQVTTESFISTLPENLGLPIFVLWFWWISDNLFANLVAQKKWPIEATIALLLATLIYFFMIFLVLAIIALIVSFIQMGPVDKIVALWDWGFSSLKALTSIFQ
jgi:hypothetical protein